MCPENVVWQADPGQIGGVWTVYTLSTQACLSYD